MHCLSSAHAVGDCNAMSGDEGGGWSVMAQWRAARRPSQSWGTFARVHQRAEARSKSARAVSAWRAQSKSTWKASSSGRGVVAAAELVMVGGILAAAGGEVGVGNEPGPEAALVGREGGVGDVPGCVCPALPALGLFKLEVPFKSPLGGSSGRA